MLFVFSISKSCDMFKGPYLPFRVVERRQLSRIKFSPSCLRSRGALDVLSNYSFIYQTRLLNIKKYFYFAIVRTLDYSGEEGF